jgi:hypothetical protein
MARIMATLETKTATQARVSKVSDKLVVEFDGIEAALSSRQRLSWTLRYLAYRLKLPIWELPRLRGSAVSGLTDIAVFLGGRERKTLHAEWRAHLAGESGLEPGRMGEALGFIVAAIRCRCSDAADAIWTLIDAILRSRALSNFLVFGPTAMAALFILRREGILGALESAESISAIGAILYGLVRVGRWWRNVKPPEPKARRAKE